MNEYLSKNNLVENINTIMENWSQDNHEKTEKPNLFYHEDDEHS